MSSATKSNLKGMGSNKTIIALMFLLAFAIAGFITVLVITSTESGYDKQYIRHAGELRVLSQEIAKNANEAALGETAAFDRLRSATNEFERRWGYLTQGDSSNNLPPSPAQVRSDVSAVQTLWERVQGDSQQILDSQNSVTLLHEVAAGLNQSMPQLQAEYDEVIAIMLANRARADQVAAAQRQSWLAERIVRNVNRILTGGEDAVLASDAFEIDAAEFSAVHNAMLKGDRSKNIAKVTDRKVLAIFDKISDQFQLVRDSSDRITQSSPELFVVRDAANSISSSSKELLEKTSTLTERFQNLPQERPVQDWMGNALGLAALAIIALLGLQIYRDTRKRLSETSETNDRNQQAIMRLLDEIADLADGDLSANATVTEDFTGAIADSINFTIDQLRNLVQSINQNSALVTNAASETSKTASQLSRASENQAKEITAATGSIRTIADSMKTVSSQASESAQVATKSVDIANNGSKAVRNTMDGMDKIREQIQKTSKQIKRLGESSQEIGDIISLINDIAEQTNILSLNAAIQASMAGEAGRGFAVVADEVQRLAERSSAATRQIEVLVKTIQADTNEAVISMEQTTSQVVEGARLAKDAGVALEEIEQVSNDLAELITQISSAAESQSESANNISHTMNVIQEITSQTSSGTTATASSIGNLAQMANEMQKSVAGFTLPADSHSQAMNEANIHGEAGEEESPNASAA